MFTACSQTPSFAHQLTFFCHVHMFSPPKKTRVNFFFSSEFFFQKTIISHPATMSNQDHPHFVLFFYLLPAPGQI